MSDADMLFHIIDDCFVIVRRKGVYRQAKLYQRGPDLFAGIGGGFVRLLPRGGSTVPDLSWDFISPHPSIRADHLRVAFGAPCLTVVAAE